MKKTLAIAFIAVLSGCEDWSLDMNGDHYPDPEPQRSCRNCSVASEPETDDAEEPPPPPAMLPPSPAPTTSTSDAGVASHGSCEGPDSCPYFGTMSDCESQIGCTWVPK